MSGRRDSSSSSDSDDGTKKGHAGGGGYAGAGIQMQTKGEGLPPPGVVYTQPMAAGGPVVYTGQAQPVMGNPTLTWMPRPVIQGCPEGLEYLTQIDQLIIKQEVELLEAFTGWEQNNKYRIFNSMGQQVYYVIEDSTCCQRQFCKNARGFTMNVLDNNQKVVLKFERDFVCCTGCCWCATSNNHCSYQMKVVTPDDTQIGHVSQEQSCWKPRIAAQSADQDSFGVFHGPCCVCNCPCTGDVEFPLMAMDGATQIGKLSKHWTGLAKEWFTNADNFSVTFPMDMDVKAKATILGTAFVVDMLFFQNNNN